MLSADRSSPMPDVADDVRALDQRIRDLAAAADAIALARCISDSCRAMSAIDRRSAEIRAEARELIREIERLGRQARERSKSSTLHPSWERGGASIGHSPAAIL